MLKKLSALILFLFLLSFGLSSCGAGWSSFVDPDEAGGAGSGAHHYVGLCDTKAGRMVVCDLDAEDWTSPDAMIWEYPGVRCAGFKFRSSKYWNGDVVLVTGDRCGAMLIDYATKHVLWSTRDVPNNPHSIELLPDGNVVVAASTGNTVRIYAATQPGSNYYQDYDLPDAHGVLYDPENEVLWALGSTYLRAYRITGTVQRPALTEEPEMGAGLPGGNGHDLSPVFGNPDLLWCTGAGGTYQFDKTTRTFSKNYVGSNIVGVLPDVKGVGNWPDGNIIFTHPDPKGRMDSWLTTWIGWIRLNDDGSDVKWFGRMVNENDYYYKCRVWIPDYQ